MIICQLLLIEHQPSPQAMAFQITDKDKEIFLWHETRKLAISKKSLKTHEERLEYALNQWDSMTNAQKTIYVAYAHFHYSIALKEGTV